MSTTSIQPITFNAVWNNENKNLKETLSDKVTRIVFFLINNIAKAIILPSSTESPRYVESVNKDFQQRWGTGAPVLWGHFTHKPIEVTTPDGIKIRGTHFKSRNAQENAPTVIFFQPNAMLSKEGTFDWILKLAAMQEFSYNFVYFDYRKCGDSQKDALHSEKSLYLDGESIYQFVKDKLHVPPKDIHFYGWSLGGGVSAHVKALHPEREGNYVIDRSFASLGGVVHNFVNVFLATIAGPILSFLNWRMRSAEAIEKIKGKTLIVHHPEDELMKNKASLYQAIFKRGTAVPPHIKELDLSRCNESPGFIHGSPIGYFNTDSFVPESEISQFLFSSNYTVNQRMVQVFRNSTSQNLRNKVYEQVARRYQNGGLYWGSGEDACYNRNGLSLTEAQLAKAVIVAKLQNT